MNSTRRGLQLIFLSCFVMAGIAAKTPLTGFAEKVSNEGTSIYHLNLFHKNYPIKYQIMGTGNKVNNISAETDNATLLVNIASQSNGRLSIELPRNIIDSKKQGNADDRYIIFEDGQVSNPEEIKTDNQTRTLAIDFDRGTGQIEISGTQIIPEFGTLSALMLAVATAGIIFAYMKYRAASVKLKC